MTVLMTLFWRLAIFRASPENAPYSPSLLALVLAGWFVLQLLVGSLQTALPIGVLVSSQLLSLTVVLAGTGLLLSFKGPHEPAVAGAECQHGAVAECYRTALSGAGELAVGGAEFYLPPFPERGPLPWARGRHDVAGSQLCGGGAVVA